MGAGSTMSAKSTVSVWTCSWTTVNRSVTAEAGVYPHLIGSDGGRVTVVDVQGLDRRILLLQQRLAQLHHVDFAGRGFKLILASHPGVVEREGVGRFVMSAAARLAKCPHQARQAGDSAHGHAAVLVPGKANPTRRKGARARP